jgi:hypothetical protein
MPSNGLVFITKSTFSAQSSVSIDNCFSATYIHYLITSDLLGSAADNGISARLRASGSDNSSSQYRRQLIYASSTTISGVRATGATFWDSAFGYTETAAFGFRILWLSNPFDAVRTTAWNDSSYDADGNINVESRVLSNDATTSYDGITFFPNSGTMTGNISVFGLVKS